MQLKKSYNIATKVSSRKSATTFGDLLDWLSSRSHALDKPRTETKTETETETNTDKLRTLEKNAHE